MIPSCYTPLFKECALQLLPCLHINERAYHTGNCDCTMPETVDFFLDFPFSVATLAQLVKAASCHPSLWHDLLDTEQWSPAVIQEATLVRASCKVLLQGLPDNTHTTLWLHASQFLGVQLQADHRRCEQCHQVYNWANSKQCGQCHMLIYCDRCHIGQRIRGMQLHDRQCADQRHIHRTVRNHLNAITECTGSLAGTSHPSCRFECSTPPGLLSAAT